ncbi:MAG TPA: branched-chain amino acid ABC transporter permease [Acidimicrobiales bacterium]|nr:branched-chain amino acid ABC transporter permease [Acidimicrobiales bacterium]
MTTVGYGLVTISILALATVGFSLQFGITNFLNIAYGDLMTLAAYFWFTFAYRLHVGIWGAGIFALIAIAMVSVLLNRLLFQPILKRGAAPFTLMVVTLGVSILILNGIVIFWGPLFFSVHISGNGPINLLGMQLTGNQIAIIVITAVLLVGLHLFLKNTLTGKSMRAMADDEQLTRACGIRVKRVQDVTWFLTGLIAGMAGFVLCIDTSAFNNSTGNSYLWLLIPAAFLGGLGNPYGAMAGAAVVGAAIELADRFLGAQFDVVAAMVVLFGVLLLRPQGIVAVVRKSWS